MTRVTLIANGHSCTVFEHPYTNSKTSPNLEDIDADTGGYGKTIKAPAILAQSSWSA